MADDFREQMRQGKLPEWPNWCFLPLGGWYAIVSADAGASLLPLHLVEDVSRLAALGTWRVTQGIFRFHPEILSALAATPLAGNMPSDVLLRLPEWCVYIETPGLDYCGAPLEGFFAHLERDANTGRAELRLLLDQPESLTPLPLHLGPWTVSEAVQRVATEALAQGEAAGLQASGPSQKELDEITASAARLVSLVLYLCSEAPEMESVRNPGAVPGNPSLVRTKKGWRLFPPSGPKVWEVGQQVGEHIRRGKEAGKRSGDRKGPRPHIRRAHWHSFWTGQRGAQQLIVRWLPPIPVAMGDDEDADKT